MRLDLSTSKTSTLKLTILQVDILVYAQGWTEKGRDEHRHIKECNCQRFGCLKNYTVRLSTRP